MDQTNKLHIGGIWVYTDYDCTIKIMQGTKEMAAILVTNESLAGKTLDERYKLLCERGQRYITCAEMEQA